LLNRRGLLLQGLTKKKGKKKKNGMSRETDLEEMERNGENALDEDLNSSGVC